MDIQLRRDHVPGTSFVAPEAGDYDVNDPSNKDVYLDVELGVVDKPGQNFRRKNGFDLECDLEAVLEGTTWNYLIGVDGKVIRINFDKDAKQVMVEGQGMAKDRKGFERGNLIVNIKYDDPNIVFC